MQHRVCSFYLMRNKNNYYYYYVYAPRKFGGHTMIRKVSLMWKLEKFANRTLKHDRHTTNNIIIS